MAAKKARKLNFKQKTVLLGEAMGFFIDEKARAAEDAALKRFTEAFVGDWRKNIEPNIKTIGLITNLSVIGSIWLPDQISVKPEGAKTHELPNGTIVERKTLVTNLPAPLMRPNLWLEDRGGSLDITHLNQLANKSRADNIFGAPGNTLVDLPAQIRLPAVYNDTSLYKLEWNDQQGRYIGSSGYYNGTAFNWVSQQTFKHLIRFYEMGRARMDAELSLLHAIAAALHGAVTFEEVIEIWPAAKNAEPKLGFVEPKANRALVSLNADDKAALCNFLAKNKKNDGGAGIACAA